MHTRPILLAGGALAFAALATAAAYGDTAAPAGDTRRDARPQGKSAPVRPAPAERAADDKFERYVERIPGSDVTFEMIPIPAGKFTIGSPADEPGRQSDEGPQREVRVGAFWMGKCEVTWNEYNIWSQSLDVGDEPDSKLDGISRPTPPYCDMTFGMGEDGYPAICMTQLAARTYCQWLSAVTGKKYRLPTEAEWEYACRAGTTTAYSFGDDPEQLEEFAWLESNSEEEYHPVGEKRPNPWGLHDMHGNVSEWVLDQYLPDAYAKLIADKPTLAPYFPATKEYPRSARGGSWMDPPEKLRSAARLGSDETWKDQDPQIPKSIWYHTDALFLGFRVVRPHDPADDK